MAFPDFRPADLFRQRVLSLLAATALPRKGFSTNIMAEILGIVASGISVAQLAGQITALGFKLTSMLQDIQGVPDELNIRLEQLQMLALVLQGPLDCGEEAPCSPLLQKARLQCQKCLSELTDMLEDLSLQIKKSRGIRRKMAISRVILKRDVWTKIERQLSCSVELLSMANQVYMIHLLESQRRYVSSVMHNTFSSYCNQLGSVSAGEGFDVSRTKESLSSIPSTPKPLKHKHSILQNPPRPDTFQRSWAFGIKFLTGVFEYGSHQAKLEFDSKDDSQTGKEIRRYGGSTPRWTAKYSLPRWWSYKVVEFSAYQAQSGWMHHLRAHNIISDAHYPPWESAQKNISSGNLVALRMQFDKRELTPWDENLKAAYSTLLLYALAFGQWGICNLLMDYGVEPFFEKSYTSWWPSFPWATYNEVVRIEDYVLWGNPADQHNRRQLMERDDQNDDLRLALMGLENESAASFHSLRRSLWPDKEYYGDSNLKQRMRLALAIARCSSRCIRAAETPGMIRYALDSQGDLSKATLEFGVCDKDCASLLHHLAGKIGMLDEKRPIEAEEWHRLNREVLRRLPTLDFLFQHPARSRGPQRETPLTRLMQKSFDPMFPVCCSLGDLGSSQKRIARCNRTAYRWLEDLQTTGADLCQFGKKEKSFRHDYTYRKDFGIDFACNEEPGRRHNRLGDIRLINFEYGDTPAQWKFWWSEMTDEFTGEFWSLVENEDDDLVFPRIPGSWTW